MLKWILADRNESIRSVAQATGIPYSTLSDLVHGKKKIGNCGSTILYKLSVHFNMPMEELFLMLENEERNEFLGYREALYEELFELGVKAFILKYAASSCVEDMYKESKMQGLYLLSLLDFLCDENGLPRGEDFEALRAEKLKEPIYIHSSDRFLSEDNFIPQFLEHNIFENRSLTGKKSRNDQMEKQKIIELAMKKVNANES